MAKVEYMHTIDAKLASNIGEDSISNPVQAIIELVKNSYDADAKRVTVTFQGTDTEDPDEKEIHKIIIRDDGIGMTDEDLRNKFFRIGTDTKLLSIASPKFGRRVVGEKGMGHYAAKRLGKVCKITSNPENYSGREYSETVDKTITVTLDWNEFITGRDFGAIESHGEILERKSGDGYGITIELEELREKNWSVEKIKQVKRELGMLLTPSSLKEEDEVDENIFEIFIEAPGFKTGDARVDTSALDMALLKLTANAEYDEPTDTTKFSYNIYKRKKNSDGFIWEKMEHHNKYESTESYDGNLFGNATFTLYNYPQSLKWREEQKKIISLKQIRSFTKEHSGIKIFNDGVRVMPFGDPSHPTLYDWLGLDQRTLGAQMGGKIRQATVVGFVELKRDSTVNINEVATREGIKETPTFEELRNFIRAMFVQLEEYRDDRETSKTKVVYEEKAKSKIEEIKRFLQQIKMYKDERSRLINILDNISKDIDQASKTKEEDKEYLLETIEMYRPLSTLGISTLAFDHEIGPKLTIVNTYLKNLLEEEELSDESHEDILAGIEKMKQIQSWREFLDIFADALVDIATSRRAKIPINLRELLKELRESLKPVLIVKTSDKEDIPINFDVSIIGNANKVYANKASILSVFTNLTLNSIKSLRFVGRKKPAIKINIWTEHKHLMIEFSDNGNGIPDENDKKIWKPFFSSYPKTGAKSQFRGMGLGLTITQDIVREQYSGEIELADTQYDKEKPGKGSATFLISMPLKELADTASHRIKELAAK